MSTLSDERVIFSNALLALLAGMDSGAAGGAGMGVIAPTRLTSINYVKAKLDELIPTGEGISFSLSTTPNVTNPLDLLIDAHLDECTKDVLLSAPLSVLVPKDGSGAAVTSFADPATGYITLPIDFLRLSSVKMTGWLTQVSG